MKRRDWMLKSAAWAGAALSLGGCANQVHEYYYGERAGGSGRRADVVQRNEQAADALLQQVALDPQEAVLVATLVNVDQLAESSRLGRLFSEQIAGRIAQRGQRVIEVKMRDQMVMRRDQGELLLTREAREVSQSHQAQAVVVGTYATSSTVLYISLKLVGPVGNVVLAAHNYTLPMDDNVRALLAGR
jgi:TolB-like protein